MTMETPIGIDPKTNQVTMPLLASKTRLDQNTAWLASKWQTAVWRIGGK